MASFAKRFLRNEWFRAFLLALTLLILLHVFILRFVTVRSTSMFATLMPGDLLLVQRWTTWTGHERGDIIVFRDPLKDRDPMWLRPLLVKRLVALPGDTLEIREGRLMVNGSPFNEAQGVTMSHLVRLREASDPRAFAERYGLPDGLVIPGRSNMETALNEELVAMLQQDEDVVGVVPMRLATGQRLNVFPFSPRYAWNGDDFGPVVIPKKGEMLRINVDNLPLYDRLMSTYEGHRLSNSGDQLLIDGLPLTQYDVEQDYCFVLGDSRHFSSDSRYWGFVPMDHIVGSATGPLFRKRSTAAAERKAREEARR